MQSETGQEEAPETTPRLAGPFTVTASAGWIWVRDQTSGTVWSGKATPRRIVKAHRLADRLNETWTIERAARDLPIIPRRPSPLQTIAAALTGGAA
jgi:hypothetical protein